ncbi:MAG: 2-(hydroxymethyl)glutarate dehydrogenase, partial [Actinomycetota bacterium]
MEATESDTKPVVGLIGLGNLGKPMALSLLASGYRMVVNSLQRAEADDLVQRGAVWAD